MGIYIYENIIPERISSEVWKSTYDETLKILEAYPFLDKWRKKTELGTSYICSARSRERDDIFDGHKGWRSLGDMKTGCNTEDYVLFSDLDMYKGKNDNGADILTDIIYKDRYPELKFEDRDAIDFVFGNKSQGEDSHLYLLAIACLIADRHPDAAVVHGDINIGQCRAAVNWANQFLEKPIDLPVQCNAKKLLKRLLSIEGADKLGGRILDLFFSLSMENADRKTGDTIRENIPENIIMDYFHTGFSDEDKLAGTVKQYLELGFDFTNLVRILVKDGRLAPSEFFDIIFGMQLQNEDKETYDFTKGDKENSRPDDVSMQFARIFGIMGGAHNHNVKAYIPLDTIRDICRKELGNMDDEIQSALDRDQKKRTEDDNIQEKFYGGKDSDFSKIAGKNREKDKKNEKYDIRNINDIVYYEPGDTFVPELEESLENVFRKVRAFTTSFDDEFLQMDRAARERCLVKMDRYILISEDTWDRIFSHIMDDEYIRRYYFILSVDISTQQVHNLIEKLMINPDVLDYYWDKTK